MKHHKFVNVNTIGACSLMSLLLLTANTVSADQRLRIPRPSETDKQALEDTHKAADAPTQHVTESASTANEMPSTVHRANASLNVDDLLPSPLSTSAIFDWQSKNLPNLQDRTGATTDNTKHRGLKAHLGGAFSVLETTVGTVANAYVPIAGVGLKTRPNTEPKIAVEAGHCPASNDPAFQVPVTWWSDLSKEEGSNLLGPQWKFWLTAVQNVFQAHAQELHETPGVASLHVMINPDGTILNVTAYTGAERGNQGYAINVKTMAHLREIILSVGKFPPFPQGSKVRCYHLIFDGSAG